MKPPHYSYRPRMFSQEHDYWLLGEGISRLRADREDRIAFRDIVEVRLYRLLMPGKAAIQKKVMWRLHLRCRSGQRLVLSPVHYAWSGLRQDRSAQYWEFTNALLSQLRSRNPDLPIITEQHWTMRWRTSIKRRVSAVGGRLILWLFWLLHDRDLDRTINMMARLMRHIGPLLRGHRVARANLSAAFPDGSEAEIRTILRGMWDNLGRVVAEYMFLDRLWDFDPKAAQPGRIVIDSTTLERVVALRASSKPALIFGAHLANWETLAVAAKALGLNCAFVFRPPEFSPAAAKLLEVRSRLMGGLIPATSGAIGKLKQALDDGVNIGLIVDQHFVGGIEVRFFGRPCRANPTLARLARQLDCAICGARAIRLPGNRFQLELTSPLPSPRDVDGKIDVAGTMQMITTTIENWIREYPDQWLWMHRRWR